MKINEYSLPANAEFFYSGDSENLTEVDRQFAELEAKWKTQASLTWVDTLDTLDTFKDKVSPKGNKMKTFPDDVQIQSVVPAYVVCQNINFSRPFQTKEEAEAELALPYWSDMEVGETVEEARVEEFKVGELEVGPYCRDTNPTVGFYGSFSQFYELNAKDEDLEWLF
jgi:hypothetical protein